MDKPISGLGNAAFALDSQALAALKTKSRAAPEHALKQAASQFEAVFMNMLLKSMRDGLPQDGAIDSDATRAYTGMLDQQLAQHLSGKGFGLAEMIVRQLARHPPGAAPVEAPDPGKGRAPAAENETRGLLPPKSGVSGGEGISERIRATMVAAAASAPASQAQQFVREMLPHARKAEQATGIPARFVLAQAALESGWGRSEPRGADGRASNNLFGIKAGSGWNGPVVEAKTTEYVNGVARSVVQRFRAYASAADSFADYSRLISVNPRYRAVLANNRDAAGFASALQQAGYATDPGYAGKIVRIINERIGTRVT